MIICMDPSIGSDNYGDQVIVRNIYNHINDVIGFDYISMGSHYYPGRYGRGMIKDSKAVLALGSNLLGYRSILRRQWKMSPLDLVAMRNKALLFGVGWNSDKANPGSLVNKFTIKYLLNNQAPHSVRDQMTATILKGMGFSNVYNTGCPTFWRLGEFVNEIYQKKKSNIAIVTLTNYNVDSNREIYWLSEVIKSYDSTYIWFQSYEDEKYFLELCKRFNSLSVIKPIGPGLHSFDNFLKNTDVDYIGTRLHGAINALHYKRRALIYSIDNRAREISKDTGIPVFNESKMDVFQSFLDGVLIVNISIPTVTIQNYINHLKEYLAISK